MVEHNMRNINIGFGGDEVHKVLLINVDVVKRAGWFSVVYASQNNLSPYSVMLFQIPYLAEGKTRSEDFSSN